MEMVKKKIQVLQQQLDEAEDRELTVQKEFEAERGLREVVRNYFHLLFFTNLESTLTCVSNTKALGFGTARSALKKMRK